MEQIGYVIQATRETSKPINVTRYNVHQIRTNITVLAYVIQVTRKITQTINVNLAHPTPLVLMEAVIAIKAIQKIMQLGNVTNSNAPPTPTNHTVFARAMTDIKRITARVSVTPVLQILMVHMEHVLATMDIKKTIRVDNVKFAHPTLTGHMVHVLVIQVTRRTTPQGNVTNSNALQIHTKRMVRVPAMTDIKKTTLMDNAKHVPLIHRGHMGHVHVIKDIRKITTQDNVISWNVPLILTNHMETAHVMMVTK